MAPLHCSLGDRAKPYLIKKRKKKVKFTFKLIFLKKERREDPGIRLTFKWYL